MTEIGYYLPRIPEAPLADIELLKLLAHKLLRIVGVIPRPEEDVPKDDMMDVLPCDNFRSKALGGQRWDYPSQGWRA